MKRLFILTLVSFMMQEVTCVTCYRCKTNEVNQDCYDFSKYNTSRRNCPDNELCGKITGVTRKGYRILIRDCFKYRWGRLNDDIRNTCLTHSGDNIDGWISFCTKDLCNSSETYSIVTPCLLVSFVVSLMFVTYFTCCF